MRNCEISFTKRILIEWLIIGVLIWLQPLSAKASGITKIDSATFRGTPEITTIHIGSDVTEISSGAFKGLFKLRSITVRRQSFLHIF